MNRPFSSGNVAVASGTTTIYTTPSGYTSIINNLTITNSGTGVITYSLLAGPIATPRTWRSNTNIVPSGTIEFNGAFMVPSQGVVKIILNIDKSCDVSLNGLEVI